MENKLNLRTIEPNVLLSFLCYFLQEFYCFYNTLESYENSLGLFHQKILPYVEHFDNTFLYCPSKLLNDQHLLLRKLKDLLL